MKVKFSRSGAAANPPFKQKWRGIEKSKREATAIRRCAGKIICSGRKIRLEMRSIVILTKDGILFITTVSFFYKMQYKD